MSNKNETNKSRKSAVTSGVTYSVCLHQCYLGEAQIRHDGHKHEILSHAQFIWLKDGPLNIC